MVHSDLRERALLPTTNSGGSGTKRDGCGSVTLAGGSGPRPPQSHPVPLLSPSVLRPSSGSAAETSALALPLEE